MTLEIKRLQLATLRGVDGGDWPVHGFVVTYPGGAALVDTGVGGRQEWLDDWRVVNRSVADALAEHDMSPADIDLVINTHLHFDHCGQNSVFTHAPVYVQRAELEETKRVARDLYDWFGFMDARFELLDGDAQILPGLEVVTTPGHTSGHQCVLVNGTDLFIGDAAYNKRVYAKPDRGERLSGQAADMGSWRASLARLRALSPQRIHYCHDS
jgi:N-acyl homoserine lactone hydrolase